MELAAILSIAGISGASLTVIGSRCLLTELTKKFSKCELAHTGFSPTGLFTGQLDRERAMKNFTFAAILVSAVISGAVAFTMPSDQPVKVDAGAGIDLSQMMASVKDLPVAYYKDYSMVFN